MSQRLYVDAQKNLCRAIHDDLTGGPFQVIARDQKALIRAARRMKRLNTLGFIWFDHTDVSRWYVGESGSLEEVECPYR